MNFSTSVDIAIMTFSIHGYDFGSTTFMDKITILEINATQESFCSEFGILAATILELLYDSDWSSKFMHCLGSLCKSVARRSR